MKKKTDYLTKSGQALEASEKGNRLFESNKFTSKDVEEVLWDTLIKVKTGKMDYDTAIAVTATGRTLCMLAKLQLTTKYVTRMTRGYSSSLNETGSLPHNTN